MGAPLLEMHRSTPVFSLIRLGLRVRVCTPSLGVGLAAIGVTLMPAGAAAAQTGPRPSVSGISPSSGPATGGMPVTITGSNLENATAVDFGSAAATVTADTATSI